ncbi:serine-tRNA ligase [endosymbiont of Sipalinus gigas]|uniref:serine--tRNA ligase n=1 Tax=endosymbiont of Sipalinus gigas TaxID=1972134 RepID=UPI000DC719F5|nr:serine--tRNA ligase [endosymbiont of Sipalinus gigas]BBA85166.1 serine-tRNA ligase [endosymbiont of Sipalinus gigas]
MIDYKLILNSCNYILENLKKRNFNLNIKFFKNFFLNKKNIQINIENLRKKKNILSEEIRILKNENKNIEFLIKKSIEIGKILSKLKIKFIEINNKLNEFLLKIPNLIDNDVPIDIYGNKNVEIYKYGYIKNFNFVIKDHISLGYINNGLDFKSSLNISGLKTVVLKDNIALMNRALINFMLDVHNKNGYKEIYVPLISNIKSLYGSGQLPKFNKDIFYIKNNSESDKALIPTSEVQLINLFRNKNINFKDLPIKLVSYSQCFRSEYGYYGKNKKGLIRLNQFDKVELIQIVDPNNSDNALEEITNDAENILKLLEIPYRRILLCSGDTPFNSCKTYDIEAWFPYNNSYIEVSSCSNTKDFQSRRISLKYKKNNKKEFLHILNASGLAVNRTLASIIENYQENNNKIRIPNVLIPYLNKIYI